MNIRLDFSTASLAQNTRWRGMGMVSGNNSSRLLMDYKILYPQKYYELLRLMFGSEGMGIQHLKIEMGADINSSSGTEPCVKRFPNEVTDVTRGAGFMLCADAKKINPDITLDMLWWSEPLWIDNATDVFDARYTWYKENLIEAYIHYGIKFDFVSATQNERGWYPDWIKYLSTRLKNEKNCPYDFSEIKIVIGDEVCTWNQSKLMVEDPELMAAVDVVGSHYTSWSDSFTLEAREKGKEIWFSEGSSPMGFSTGLYKYDGNGSGLNGLNGVLDVANRIITMYPGGKMTLCEFQPVISSYYDGVCYCHKQFITANTPWNGHYLLDPGFFMILHFSQFIGRGWAMLDGASFGDGKPGGDGHSVGDATYSFLSAFNPESNDWTSIITNTTQESIEYKIFVPENSESKNVYVYETTGWKLANTLNKREIKISEAGNLKIAVLPNSIITISTINKDPLQQLAKINRNLIIENTAESDYKNKVMELPYTDDFSYSDFGEEFLKERGMAPLFTTDEGGAFEVEKINEKNCLVQKIRKNEKSKEWGWTPDPVTNLGDDRWFNYGAQIKINFDNETCNCDENYVGLGIRYNLPCEGQNGYWVKLTSEGKWSFFRNNKEILSNALVNFDGTKEHILFIQAENDLLEIKIDNQSVMKKNTEALGVSMQGGGRVAIYSAYFKNRFADLRIFPVGKNPYIYRFDNFDDAVEYVENHESHWNHGVMESFKCYKRTVSHGDVGSKLKLKFEGAGINLSGYVNEESEFQITIDGRLDSICKLNSVNFREVFYSKTGLSVGKHILEMQVTKGKINFDSFEVIGNI